jgi:hypothetical protein
MLTIRRDKEIHREEGGWFSVDVPLGFRPVGIWAGQDA